MKISYHGKSKSIPQGIYSVKRPYFIGKTLFGYVLDLNGTEMLLSKRFPDNGKTWRYVNENN